SDNCDGINAMTRLEKALDSEVRFLLPLPDGMDAEDPELFGFWTYELRIGHRCLPHAPRQMWWSTAQGRFGRPLRVNGVQQPAPPLYCRAGRSDFPPEKVPGLVPICQSFGGGIGVGVSTGFIEVSAPFATPALNGKPLVTAFEFPKTRLCFLLYAQVVQSDGATNRNILLTHCYGTYVPPQRPNEIQPLPVTQRDRMGYS